MARRVPAKDARALQEMRQAYERGDLPTALRMAEDINKRRPDDVNVLQVMGSALLAKGDARRAVACLQKLIRLGFHDVSVYQNLASAYQLVGDDERALRTLDEYLRRDPNNPMILAAKAGILKFIGDDEQAAALIEAGLRHHPHDPNLAIVFSGVRGRADAERAAGLLEPHAHNGSLPPPTRSSVLFALGSMYDKLGRHDDAFRAMVMANRLRGPGHDPGRFSDKIDRMIAGWNPESFGAAERSGERSDRPLLVVGMPRSGTSLVEQILDTHPMVAGAGELTMLAEIMIDPRTEDDFERPEDLPRGAPRRWAQRYLKELRKHSADARYVVDKLPVNFLRLGVFGLTFPNARIIHCIRDPLDTCLSCFFTDFQYRVGFTRDLGHLGAFYRDYRRLMDHWRSLLGDRIIDVEYERLVDDLEGESRRLIDALELEWDPVVLEFHRNPRVARTASHDQVRAPIYRSAVARHTRYDKHLGRLRQAIQHGAPRAMTAEGDR